MYITDDELSDRIDSEANIINRLEVKKLHNGGRREGQKNLPNLVREVIAVAAREDGPVEAAKAFGVSRTHASRLSAGIINHEKGRDPELGDKVDNIIKAREEQAHEAAIENLIDVLGIVKEKAADIKKPETAAKIASDMAKVASSLRPKDAGNNINAGQVIIYAPDQKHISQYAEVNL